MEPSLEIHAATLKGYLLNQETPPEIMNAADALLIAASSKSIVIRTVGHVSVRTESQEPLETHLRVIDAAENPKPKVKKRERPSKIDPVKDLAAIQERHDAGIPNGVIAKDYDVVDQTIVNYLKRYGNYHPQATGGRPKREKPAPAPKPEKIAPPAPAPKPVARDAFGSPMRRPYHSKKKIKTGRSALEPGILQPGDLVDIHEMLAAGQDLNDVATHFKCTLHEAETFVYRNRAVSITRCDPKPADHSVYPKTVRPTSGYRGPA